MLFIIGTSEKNKYAGTSEKPCPFCSEKMQVFETKQYFSAFFIPLFPVKDIESFYFCPNCKYKVKK